MYEIDHILNRNYRHHQLIQESQDYQLARTIKATQGTRTKNKAISSVRVVLIALINLIMR